MRKLILQMQISADGFVSTGPDDEQLWVTWAWEEIREHVLGLLDASDTILIGRKLAVDYIPYWEEVSTRPDDPMYGVARRIAAARKVVFSRTLTESVWANTEVTANLEESIRKLKNAPGKNLIVYGGTSFVADLIQAGLIDEYHLFVNPVVLGKGESVFSKVEKFRGLRLKSCVPFPSGIVWMQYVPMG